MIGPCGVYNIFKIKNINVGIKLNVCKTKCNATLLVLTFVMDISYNILKVFGFF
jgi:hypothetical protein